MPFRVFIPLRVLAGETLPRVAGDLVAGSCPLRSDSVEGEGENESLREFHANVTVVIDEIGYLSYSNRHADLLFELVSRRYETKSTIVTTNKAFSDWSKHTALTGGLFSIDIS